MAHYQLQPDEEVLLELRPCDTAGWYWAFRWSFHFMWVVAVAVVLMAAQLVEVPTHDLAMAFGFIQSALHNHFGITLPSEVMLVATAIFLMAAIVVVLYLLSGLVVNAYVYTITNQRVMLRYGLFSLNQRMITYAQINDVNLRASFIERLFGLGSVYLDTMSTMLAFNRNSIMNNSCRLEGLSEAQCQQVMGLISARMQKLRMNQ